MSDKAGNTTSATSAPVKIDKTSPSTDASAPSGWVNSSVDVTLTPHDALSGVDATFYVVDSTDPVPTYTKGTTVTLTGDGTHDVAYYSVDKAGNVETTKHVTVQIDKTKPTITHKLDPAANGNGWNNADVTVTFTCADQADPLRHRNLHGPADGHHRGQGPGGHGHGDGQRRQLRDRPRPR